MDPHYRDRSLLSPGGGSHSRLFSTDSPRGVHGGRDYAGSYLMGADMRSPSGSMPRTPAERGYGGMGTPASSARRPSAVGRSMHTGSARRGMPRSAYRGDTLGMRQRSTMSARGPMSDAPPTASYDDDEDDEAAALLVAAGGDSRYPRSPDRRMSRGPVGTPAGGGYGMDSGALRLAGRGGMMADGAGMGMGESDGFVSHDTAAAAAGLTREDDGLYRNNRWVTVFGFRPGLSSAVLRHFQAYGTVVSQRVSNSNWLHLQYETVDQASSALGANGRVHDGFMLGVVRCTDMTALQADGDAGASVGHHKIGRASADSAETHLDSETIFKPRRRRKNICRKMCDWLCKSW